MSKQNNFFIGENEFAAVLTDIRRDNRQDKTQITFKTRRSGKLALSGTTVKIYADDYLIKKVEDAFTWGSKWNNHTYKFTGAPTGSTLRIKLENNFDGELFSTTLETLVPKDPQAGECFARIPQPPDGNLGCTKRTPTDGFTQPAEAAINSTPSIGSTSSEPTTTDTASSPFSSSNGSTIFSSPLLWVAVAVIGAVIVL